MDWYTDLWAWGLDGFMQMVLVVIAHLAVLALAGRMLRGRSSQH